MLRTILVLTLLLLSSLAQAKVVGKEVSYSGGGVTMRGYIAYDTASKGKRPGVLVVHEWWGHNDYARRRARMLAGLGYVALALDMYGDGKQAAHPDDAQKFSSAVRQNMDQAEQRFLAAMNLLKKNPRVDSKRIAAIGYCFGGGIVLEMARRGLDLKGVASFHGSLATDHLAEPGKVKASILVLNGLADPFTSEKQLYTFNEEMAAAGVDYQVISYVDAKHAFTNPDADRLGQEFGLPLAYNAEADKLSWAELEKFLKRVFAQ